MIVLDVEGYCHHCPHFKPHAENSRYFYAKGEIRNLQDITVRCEHKHRCKHVEKLIRQSIEEEGEKK